MVGCFSGMNDAGLTVAVMEAYQVPFALCLRRLLEQCSSIEEARALLNGIQPV